MSYIPKDAQWFIAQLVEEFRVEGNKRNAVHINYVLVAASKPEEAYRKALELEEQANSEYKNPEGKKVVHRFVGLRDLDVVYFPIEHGCEVLFEERLGVGPAALRRLVGRKSDLEAFRPVPLRRPRGRPDYSSKEIMDMVAKDMGRAEPTAPPNRHLAVPGRFGSRGRAAVGELSISRDRSQQ